MTFFQKLTERSLEKRSNLCVGLDPDPQRISPGQHPGIDQISEFCHAIVEATVDHAVAFKPNQAFFEALGWEGAKLLEELCAAISGKALIVVDGKRGDIGNTAGKYAASVYDILGADACTVSTYMGGDALNPFLQKEGHAAFALVKTSNQTASEFQDIRFNDEPLFYDVARAAVDLANECPGEAGFVVGANSLEILGDLADRFPTAPILIPGVGAQGGSGRDVGAVMGKRHRAFLVNSSRGVLYAGQGNEAMSKARDAAEKLRKEIEEGVQSVL